MTWFSFVFPNTALVSTTHTTLRLGDTP
jgi:hypothetical protein